MSFCLYVIIKQTWSVKAIIVKQIKFMCPFEIYMEISFSHSNWNDVNGRQRASAVLSVYSGEFEHCKDICRSEMRLIDRDVCEDRKNLHSACQQVELSVLRLTTSICRTNTTGLRSRERKKKKKGKRSHLRTARLLGKSHVLWFCSKISTRIHLLYRISSLACRPACATAVCSRVLQSSTWSGFPSGILQAHSLCVQAWFCTSDDNSILIWHIIF